MTLFDTAEAHGLGANEELLGADAVELSGTDIRKIDHALQAISVEGNRFALTQQNLVGR